MKIHLDIGSGRAACGWTERKGAWNNGAETTTRTEAVTCGSCKRSAATKPPRLTALEAGVLLAAATNADPAMFEAGNTEWSEAKALAALESAKNKLRGLIHGQSNEGGKP